MRLTKNRQKLAAWCLGGILFYSVLLSTLFEVRAIWKKMKWRTNSLYTLQQLALSQGVSFDQRTPTQAYSDLLKDFPTAVTHLPPSLFYPAKGELKIRGNVFQPLGGVSREVTLGWGEMGEWRRYTTDEYGFRNPIGLYSMAPIDILVLGDSFAIAESVSDEENIAGRFRRSNPKTINLGVSDIGPLTELAILREYGTATRPKNVIWLYYDGNDISGITEEMESPILRKYIDPNDFKQSLVAIQPELDTALRNLIKERFEISKKVSTLSNFLQASADFPDKLFDILYFRAFRRAAGLSETPLNRVRFEGRPDQLKVFSIIAKAIQRECSKFNGELTFVYLPEWLTLKYPVRKDRDPVLAIIRDLNIPIVDGVQILSQGGDPLSYFPLRFQGHYTPEGYRVIQEAISEHIK